MGRWVGVQLLSMCFEHWAWRAQQWHAAHLQLVSLQLTMATQGTTSTSCQQQTPVHTHPHLHKRLHEAPEVGQKLRCHLSAVLFGLRVEPPICRGQRPALQDLPCTLCCGQGNPALRRAGSRLRPPRLAAVASHPLKCCAAAAAVTAAAAAAGASCHACPVKRHARQCIPECHHQCKAGLGSHGLHAARQLGE